MAVMATVVMGIVAGVLFVGGSDSDGGADGVRTVLDSGPGWWSALAPDVADDGGELLGR